MYDDSRVPAWASEILTVNGLGFEIKGLKAVLWDYFAEQFENVECDLHTLKSYFVCYVQDAIENGNAQKAIATLHQLRADEMKRPRNIVRQSKLTEFEQKYADYLRDED